MKHVTVPGNAEQQPKPQTYRNIRVRRWKRLKRDKWLYILLLPGLLYFLIFKYVPMWGCCWLLRIISRFLVFRKVNG